MAPQDHNFFLATVLVLATVLLVFAMKYMSAARQARLRSADETLYRSLAEKANAAQSATTASLSAIQSDLADAKARLASVEKMLREVG